MVYHVEKKKYKPVLEKDGKSNIVQSDKSPRKKVEKISRPIQ